MSAVYTNIKSIWLTEAEISLLYGNGKTNFVCVCVCVPVKGEDCAHW